MIHPAAVPLTSNEQAGSAAHAIFAGRVTFYNNFDGNLPASEYPKLNVRLLLTMSSEIASY